MAERLLDRGVVFPQLAELGPLVTYVDAVRYRFRGSPAPEHASPVIAAIEDAAQRERLSWFENSDRRVAARTNVLAWYDELWVSILDIDNAVLHGALRPYVRIADGNISQGERSPYPLENWTLDFESAVHAAWNAVSGRPCSLGPVTLRFWSPIPSGGRKALDLEVWFVRADLERIAQEAKPTNPNDPNPLKVAKPADPNALSTVIKKAITAGKRTAADCRDWVDANCDGWRRDGTGLVGPDEKQYAYKDQIESCVRRYRDTVANTVVGRQG